MAGKRPPKGKTLGKGKPLVPAGPAAKGKPLVRGAKAAAAARPSPPPRALRGRIAVAMPVLEAAPVGRRMGPPPPSRGAPPRMTPPPARMAAETPRAERLEAPPSSRAPIMQQRGAPAAMDRLRRGKVAF